MKIECPKNQGTKSIQICAAQKFQHIH